MCNIHTVIIVDKNGCRCLSKLNSIVQVCSPSQSDIEVLPLFHNIVIRDVEIDTLSGNSWLECHTMRLAVKIWRCANAWGEHWRTMYVGGPLDSNVLLRASYRQCRRLWLDGLWCRYHLFHLSGHTPAPYHLTLPQCMHYTANQWSRLVREISFHHWVTRTKCTHHHHQ